MQYAGDNPLETARPAPLPRPPESGTPAGRECMRPDSVVDRVQGSHTGIGRFRDAVLGIDANRRIRLTQWLIAVLVYVAIALVIGLGPGGAWVDATSLLAWTGFIGIGLAGIYAAIRSRWSERFSDPALTSTQMVLGVVAVAWGYLICGPARSVTLLPLLLIFTFGAFSLSWRRFAALTVFAFACLVAVVVALHASRGGDWSLDHIDLRIDLANLLMMAILLPAISLVASRLSALRSRLRLQREKLTGALREVQRLATHDDLTGLVNRRFMQERIAQEQARFERTGSTFSIALIDIDHFKRINDVQGHAGGDEVLRAFAAAIAATLRASDIVARWGGEEFLLLLPDTDATSAQASLERLLALVLQMPLCPGFALSFSAGVTGQRPGETVAVTVARADAAMYAAKRAGRSRVVVQ